MLPLHLRGSENCGGRSECGARAAREGLTAAPICSPHTCWEPPPPLPWRPAAATSSTDGNGQRRWGVGGRLCPCERATAAGLAERPHVGPPRACLGLYRFWQWSKRLAKMVSPRGASSKKHVPASPGGAWARHPAGPGAPGPPPAAASAPGGPAMQAAGGLQPLSRLMAPPPPHSPLRLDPRAALGSSAARPRSRAAPCPPPTAAAAAASPRPRPPAVEAHEEGRDRRQVRHPLRRLAAQADQEDRGQPALQVLLQLLRQGARGRAAGAAGKCVLAIAGQADGAAAAANVPRR